MKYLLLVLAIPLLSEQCTKSKNGIPDCIQQKINEIKAEPKWNPPAQVDEYIYNKKHVYLFSSNCCDQFNIAYDENCNAICAPSGGIAGQGDRKCADFNKEAKYVRLVWKDER
ncbi:MAG: hypothetical protein WDN26_22400 [Chitinophagaceae bacterium]